MRQEKQLLLDEIKGQIDANPTFVIMSYSGLNADTTTSFRNAVVGMGGSVEMVKKRVLIKAALEAGIELDLAALPGHISLVFTGEDSIQVTKAVYQLRKDTNKAVEVLGGRFDGELYSSEDVEKLSELPSKDQMRAQLLSVFEAPMSQTVAVMDTILCSVLYCLENKAKKESST